MATAQKRGFRFPWGSDGRRDAPEARDNDEVPEPTLAQRIGAVPDDIGRGPFDLGTAAVADPPVEATGDERVEGTDSPVQRKLTDDEAGEHEPVADGQHAPAGIGVAEAAPDAPAVEASASAGEPAAAKGEAEPSAGAPAAPAPTAWPESDRRAARPPITVAPASAAAAAPRRDNKLMTGLVRAMRDAARVARDEAVAALRADAAQRGTAIRAESAATGATLRRNADADVVAIREWSKAEIARIREETEARIGARKVRLAGETESEAKAAEDRLARLAAAVQAYEAETATFFDALLAEDDPARLAGLAERMPTPPALNAIASAGGSASGRVMSATTRGKNAKSPASRPSTRTTKSKPGSAPAVAVGGVADAAASSPVMPTGEPARASSEDESFEIASEPFDGHDTRVPGPTPEPELPDALDAEAAAAAEAEALAGLEGHTQVVASGLIDVAAIAGFKAALVRSDGISAVSVNAGSEGDVLYAVTHAGDLDIRRTLRELDGFQTRLIADDGASVVVVVHQAAA